MREALNNNPMVQLAVIGVLILTVGLFFMMNMKKGSSGAGTTAATTPPPTSSAGGTAAPVPAPGGATAGAAIPTSPIPPAASGTVTPDALIPGPGLPKNVVAAWKRGDAVALLIVRGSGIDDHMLRTSAAALSSEPRVSVFTSRAKSIARYSRITQGVGVDRVPALVVIRPRSVSGSVPEAVVSYGFRSSRGVVQAVHDALYTGRDDLTYSPR
jgi:hypothetical protein